jgi:hypothetical protein
MWDAKYERGAAYWKSRMFGCWLTCQTSPRTSARCFSVYFLSPIQRDLPCCSQNNEIKHGCARFMDGSYSFYSSLLFTKLTTQNYRNAVAYPHCTQKTRLTPQSTVAYRCFLKKFFIGRENPKEFDIINIFLVCVHLYIFIYIFANSRSATGP